MHNIEPFYNWRDHYIASEDEDSPFFGREYSEFEFSNTIYNYFIHPQWDDIGSPTLFIKILYVDYSREFAIIELIGEWNDCIHNDVMFLKRNIIDKMQRKGICKFVLIGENVLNFHASDDSYYEEWFEDVNDEGGWLIAMNFRPHVLQEMCSAGIQYYLLMNEQLDSINWRTLEPTHLHNVVEGLVMKAIEN